MRAVDRKGVRRAIRFGVTFGAAATAALLLMIFAPRADAVGGRYVFEGGSTNARAHVRAALNASSFDWSAVPVEVTIHIRRGVRPHSTPGEIWLDPRLLAAGRFAWGIVQHEYAHQVAFFVFGRAERTRLTRLLGARAWCHEIRRLAHDEHACERFSSTLAYAYWPSRHNVEKHDAVIAPARFRVLLRTVIPGARTLQRL